MAGVTCSRATCTNAASARVVCYVGPAGEPVELWLCPVHAREAERATESGSRRRPRLLRRAR